MFTRSRTRKPLTIRRAFVGALLPWAGLALGFGGMTALAASGLVPLTASSVPAESPASARPTSGPDLDRLDALSARYECSRTGLGEGVIPARALLLAEDGETVRVVSFERGWASFEGKAPGTLLSVCAK